MNQSLVPRNGTRQALGWYIPRFQRYGRSNDLTLTRMCCSCPVSDDLSSTVRDGRSVYRQLAWKIKPGVFDDMHIQSHTVAD